MTNDYRSEARMVNEELTLTWKKLASYLGVSTGYISNRIIRKTLSVEETKIINEKLVADYGEEFVNKYIPIKKLGLFEYQDKLLELRDVLDFKYTTVSRAWGMSSNYLNLSLYRKEDGGEVLAKYYSYIKKVLPNWIPPNERGGSNNSPRSIEDNPYKAYLREVKEELSLTYTRVSEMVGLPRRAIENRLNNRSFSKSEMISIREELVLVYGEDYVGRFISKGRTGPVLFTEQLIDLVENTRFSYKDVSKRLFNQPCYINNSLRPNSPLTESAREWVVGRVIRYLKSRFEGVEIPKMCEINYD